MSRSLVLSFCLSTLALAASANNGDEEEVCALQTRRATPEQAQTTFDEQCAAWLAKGPKPTTCEGVESPDGNFKACYLGLPPVTPDRGAYCVDGEMVTCEEYCAKSHLCPEGFCSDAATFLEQCHAWTDGTGAKPSTCEGVLYSNCFKYILPISPENGTFCVDGALASCASYCQARDWLYAHVPGGKKQQIHHCPEGFCGSDSFGDQCQRWLQGPAPLPTACEGVKLDGCYVGVPVTADKGAFCVDGHLATCDEYCQAEGDCPDGFCASS